MTKIVNVYIVYDIDVWPRNPTSSFKLKNCLFGATNIVKNSDKKKYVYSGYGITFDSAGSWSFGIDFVNKNKQKQTKKIKKANKNEAKVMTEHISCECKHKFNNTICNSNQKWNNKTCQCECKSYRKCKKDYSWNPSTCICENSKYLKSIADTSVTECDEIVIIMDIVSTKKTNTIATKNANVTSTASIKYHSQKVRDCYILLRVLLAIILILIITITAITVQNKKV